MIRRSPAFRIVFLLLYLFYTHGAVAQPTLPDLTGTFEKGVVALTWNCQYNGIKAISVLRSSDSTNDYEIIGYVKRLDKGVQVFSDIHPQAGKIFYKLAIVFKTGLTWRSNHFGIYVPIPAVESSQKFPSADSLKKTPDKINNQDPGFEKESDIKKQTANNITADSIHIKPKNDTCIKQDAKKPKISLSFYPDTSLPSLNTHHDTEKSPVTPRQKIALKIDDPNTNTPIFIRSRFINSDSATGHVNIFLPDDVFIHLYSVKFFDLQNHMIVEIPKINTPAIILDKRNFQHKGVFKFTLRKDYLELETGYIIVNP